MDKVTEKAIEQAMKAHPAGKGLKPKLVVVK